MRFFSGSSGSVRLLLAFVVGVSFAVWAACSRKADIYDEPASTVTPTPTGAPLDGGLKVIDAGFDDPSHTACDERREDEDCVSSNDFPCNFEALVEAVARDCKLASGCTANGWLAAELGDDGCATRLEMTEPNPKFIDCAAKRFSSVQCPCGKSRSQIFLGLGNNGCPDAGPRACSSGELQCDTGEVCINGVCVRASGGAGSQ